MDRRQFCRTTLAASVAAAIPALQGCERDAPVATSADTSMRAISLDGAELELEKAAIRELGESLNGPVILSGASSDGDRRRHLSPVGLDADCLRKQGQIGKYAT